MNRTKSDAMISIVLGSPEKWRLTECSQGEFALVYDVTGLDLRLHLGKRGRALEHGEEIFEALKGLRAKPRESGFPESGLTEKEKDEAARAMS